MVFSTERLVSLSGCWVSIASCIFCLTWFATSFLVQSPPSAAALSPVSSFTNPSMIDTISGSALDVRTWSWEWPHRSPFASDSLVPSVNAAGKGVYAAGGQTSAQKRETRESVDGGIRPLYLMGCTTAEHVLQLSSELLFSPWPPASRPLPQSSIALQDVDPSTPQGSGGQDRETWRKPGDRNCFHVVCPATCATVKKGCRATTHVTSHSRLGHQHRRRSPYWLALRGRSFSLRVMSYRLAAHRRAWLRWRTKSKLSRTSRHTWCSYLAAPILGRRGQNS